MDDNDIFAIDVFYCDIFFCEYVDADLLSVVDNVPKSLINLSASFTPVTVKLPLCLHLRRGAVAPPSVFAKEEYVSHSELGNPLDALWLPICCLLGILQLW